MLIKKHPKVFAVRSILACAKKSQLAAMLLAIVTGCATKSEFQPRNPISPGFADPTVIRDENGTWWAYGTNGGGYAVPMLYSENLAEWRFAGSALKTMPDWHPNRFRAGLWAPHITRIGKVYVLYYSLAVWKPKPGEVAPAGIGVATSPTPRGPFTDLGKLFFSEEIGVSTAIDPYLFQEDGKVFLFWGSYRGGIWVIELSADGLELLPGAKPLQIGSRAYEGSWIEKIGDTYWFFGSTGTCCAGAKSTYSVVAARSDNLRGPFTGKTGQRLLDDGGTQILRGDKTVVGPGHIALTRDDDGKYWILYHAFSPTNQYKNRQLYIDRLRFDNDGWPYVNDGHPSYPKEYREYANALSAN